MRRIDGHVHDVGDAYSAKVTNSDRAERERTEIGHLFLSSGQLAGFVLAITDAADVFGSVRAVSQVTTDRHANAADADVSSVFFATARRSIFDAVAEHERSFEPIVGHLADQLAPFTGQDYTKALKVSRFSLSISLTIVLRFESCPERERRIDRAVIENRTLP